MSIEDLGLALQNSFSGELGKQSSSLVAKTVSTKMPGGFNANSAKSHIQSSWGLGPQRQQGVMLLAMTMQPPSRLNSEDEAKAFLDEVARAYAIQAGISLASPGSGNNAATGGNVVMLDSAALESVKKDQRQLSIQQFSALAAHLKVDLQAADKVLINAQTVRTQLQDQLDLWNTEHGEVYGSGIVPKFSPLKVRTFDSAWNWAREDILTLHNDVVSNRVSLSDHALVAQKSRIVNRSSRKLLDFLQHLSEKSTSQTTPGSSDGQKVALELFESCREAIESPPFYQGTLTPTAPQTSIDSKGSIKYTEVPRDAVSTALDYIHEMSRGTLSPQLTPQIFSESSRIESKQLSSQQPNDLLRAILKLQTLQQDNFSPHLFNTLTPPDEDFQEMPPIRRSGTDLIPHLHLKQLKGTSWGYSRDYTNLYLQSLGTMAQSGLTFQHKTALMTGTGNRSIGSIVLQNLLSGGARVIATTSSFSQEVTQYYRGIYAKYGSRGSQLILLPFNQGSRQDTERLIEYIYGRGWDLDYVIPFAAISEIGREIDNIDSKSELAHRIMLTNLVRLLGSIKRHKQSKGFQTRPSQVILPLSPNHGTFGGDGLYAESKMALESLFNKWRSEAWSEYLTICGASIGWTRGTGLMSENDSIAEEVEKLGVRTFSQEEMAFNILGLMMPAIKELCESEPIYADMTGSMLSIDDLEAVTSQLRKDISEKSETRKMLTKVLNREMKLIHGEAKTSSDWQHSITPKANIDFEFPALPEFKDIARMGKNLEGMVDLEKVVVVVGFAEIGPLGNARTRWDMEAHGKFSLEGCIEMAWIMGHIKYHNGPIKGKQGPYTGWVDNKTGNPIEDHEVKRVYEKQILAHSGIRLVEPDLLDSDQRALQEVVIQEDLEPFETSKASAQQFKSLHGDKAEIVPLTETDYTVRLRAGATVLVPRTLDFSRWVAALVPTGWDAQRYGIPQDIIAQVDRVTLYALVSTAEALLSAGITDPYELYQYVHVSEVGNCIGSGLGGSDSLRGIFRDRAFDKPVQSDILQESFINTIGAWVNMLLMSSSGPLKTPVAACATAIESIDVGYQTIISGQAKVCLVGGADGYGTEVAQEFSNMKATSNAEDERKRGRSPAEMSRPATSSRSGFVESEGAGVQVIMTAKLALEMGLPIRGIVALTATASDKIGRSVPAPGQGILTIAAEEKSQFPSPLLDIDYRREQLEQQLKNVEQWKQSEMARLQKNKANHAPDYIAEYANHIERTYQQRRSDALNSWGNNFWKQDPSISPLRGALATWGLDIDDLNVVSLHGTSTMANDRNEADVISKQLHHLGRTKGNVVMAVCQKHLTGHPKGPAGAWMFNGGMQIMNTGLVPGNRNADNIDSQLEDHDLIFYPSRSLQVDEVKTVLTNSFGFGQKSAQALAINPKYLFAALDQSSYESYKIRCEARYRSTYRHTHRAWITNSIFRAKDKTPYAAEHESQVLLSPNTRLGAKRQTPPVSHPAPPKGSSISSKAETEYKAIAEQLTSASASINVQIGVDIEDVEAINISNETFITRNFSSRERAYCQAAPSPQESFAGRWSAKEAVFKSLGIAGKGAGASMIDIEIINDENGKPLVTVSRYPPILLRHWLIHNFIASQ